MCVRRMASEMMGAGSFGRQFYGTVRPRQAEQSTQADGQKEG